MGFWDVVKSVALSAKCMTGWHSGNYKPIEGKPECNMGKTCPDCNEYVTTVKHKFGDWVYPEYGSCDAVKTCIHCEYEKHDTVHSYKETGNKNSQCQIIEKCQRCEDKKTGRTEHEWYKLGSYELKTSDSNGDKKRKCKNCGTLG